MTALKYRTRSEYIEAMQLTADNVKEVALWCGGQEVEEFDPVTDERFAGINIPTMDGTARVSQGDYIFRDAKRRFWRRSAQEFQKEFVPF